MRNFLKFISLILVVAAVVGYYNQDLVRGFIAKDHFEGYTGSVTKVTEQEAEFVELKDIFHNSQMMRYRTEKCGRYQEVLAEIQERFDRRTEKDMVAAEWNYGSALAIDVMRQAVSKKVMGDRCLAIISSSIEAEASRFILLTPRGEFVFDLEFSQEDWRTGKAFSPYRKVDVEGWMFDTLMVADFTRGFHPGMEHLVRHSEIGSPEPIESVESSVPVPMARPDRGKTGSVIR